mgnify:CR=1 FL=1
MNVKERHRHLLFPTPIWQFMFEDCQAFNERLHHDIVSFDWEAYKQEKNLYFGGDLASRNEDTFIPVDRAPGLVTLLKFSVECAAEGAAEYGWDLDGRRLEVVQFWANVNRPNEYNMQHNHAPNHLSGVYYVSVPAGSGDIKFIDDRRVRAVTEPRPVRDSALAYQSYTFQPVPGMLLIFPSWLDHVVGQNKSGEVRTAVSFNIDLVRQPTTGK